MSYQNSVKILSGTYNICGGFSHTFLDEIKLVHMTLQTGGGVGIELHKNKFQVFHRRHLVLTIGI